MTSDEAAIRKLYADWFRATAACDLEAIMCPDGTAFDSVSRGTRVFRKIGRRWTMIHQHVSYPYDPQSGAARTDLTPP